MLAGAYIVANWNIEFHRLQCRTSPDARSGREGGLNEMAQTNRVPFYIPIFNRIIVRLLRVGVPMGPMILLTVRGRTSGQPRTTPVGLFEQDGHRWLLATFGETNWTRNLRAAGEGILTRGRRREAIAAVELARGRRARPQGCPDASPEVARGRIVPSPLLRSDCRRSADRLHQRGSATPGLRAVSITD